ncbi:phage tail sheath family protein [Aerosakkonema sp. BLCC-F183]|uniref:phage tail sheath family protein n=1 Tax=Aerosakkonema sp. BLCC-F183 TaxID=3342834 RepID=UPI0035B9D0CD
MATYLSPGVYVKEIPSGSAPIVGVGTSIAAFIGVIPDNITIPTAPIIDTQEELSTLNKKNLEGQILNADGEPNKNIYKWQPTIKIEGQPKNFTINIKNETLNQVEHFQITPPTNGMNEYIIQFTKDRTITATEKVKIEYECKSVSYPWENYPGEKLREDWEVWVGDRKLNNGTVENNELKTGDVGIKKPSGTGSAEIVFKNVSTIPEGNFTIKYRVLANQVNNEQIGKFDVDSSNNKLTGYPERNNFELKSYFVNTQKGTFTIKINGEVTKIDNVKLESGSSGTRSQLTIPKSDLEKSFSDKNLKYVTITVDYQKLFPTFTPVQSGEVKLCTNFNEFKKYFGDFSTDPEQNNLAHAVYGFFNNGGTRCYVMRVKDKADIRDSLLEKLEAIDEISIVAAPGITSAAVRSAIITHCQQKTGDRFAILDCHKNDTIEKIKGQKPGDSNYAAFYFPWIVVLDPATKIQKVKNKLEEGLEEGLIYVPPSGHIAGIYARVDAQRGVHKAPANETILGALGLKQNISKNQQEGLNPEGINCIRKLNDNVLVWGARTIGGDKNGEFKYINVRRVFNYLKKSIDKGTQWTVFEPNSPELWAKIRRNVTAFLTIAWRDGALFGNTPEQAFYVKCDEETNPLELREQGQVVTEIGVAIVKPAEFVIFNLSQWAGPGK